MSKPLCRLCKKSIRTPYTINGYTYDTHVACKPKSKSAQWKTNNEVFALPRGKNKSRMPEYYFEKAQNSYY